VRFPSAERYEAVSIGTARLRCRDGDVVLEVRAPVRIAIDPVPTACSGARLYYGAKIYDSAVLIPAAATSSRSARPSTTASRPRLRSASE